MGGFAGGSVRNRIKGTELLLPLVNSAFNKYDRETSLQKSVVSVEVNVCYVHNLADTFYLSLEFKP